jgi:hypothetical protein
VQPGSDFAVTLGDLRLVFQIGVLLGKHAFESRVRQPSDEAPDETLDVLAIERGRFQLSVVLRILWEQLLKRALLTFPWVG